MGSKPHFYISLAKSALRIAACVMTIATRTILPMAALFLLAEILGIAEELGDKR